MSNKRYAGTLAVCIALIAYASLYPFWPLRSPGEDVFAAFFSKPRYPSGFDFVLNFAAYVPLGAIACLHFRGATAHPLVRTVALGAILSFTFEIAQIFIVTRVASIYDVMANAAGAFTGALLVVEPFYGLATAPLGEWRARNAITGPWGNAGIVLLALWLLSQLNPAIPFFGAGDIASEGHGDRSLQVLEWIAVGLSICGFCLFVSAILRDRGGARVTVVLLSAALWLKFVAASFMLKPHLSAEWLQEGRVAGLAGGFLAFLPLRRLARLARIYLALVLILAGALFSKIFGAYSATEELTRVFSWPYGQLENFATLTRFLHELWPLLALGFLVGLFFHARRNTMEP